jgi:hypothetical protein
MLYARIPEFGNELMEQDIANLKLVKSYVKEALPSGTAALQNERDTAIRTHEEKLRDIDRRSESLKDCRQAALVMIRKGMELLEQQAEASRKEVDFFRTEVAAAGQRQPRHRDQCRQRPRLTNENDFLTPIKFSRGDTPPTAAYLFTFGMAGLACRGLRSNKQRGMAYSVPQGTSQMDAG